MRQHAGVVAKQPVAAARDVAIGVGDDEAVAMLQRKLPVRVARPGVVERGQRDGRVELAFVELVSCRVPGPSARRQLGQRRDSPARPAARSGRA